MKEDRVFLLHILECAERIREYTQAGRSGFLQDRKTQDAVLRNFEVIGEAAKRVSSETRDLAAGIPWTRIAGFQDVLIHRYEGVDLEQVWQRVERDLPLLEEEVRQLVSKS
jgi:uncharacterized protein with HEPN domain